MADGHVHPWQQLRNKCAHQFQATDDELAERLDSGGSRFDSRVQWAITHMVQADLLRRPKRGHVEITRRGVLGLDRVYVQAKRYSADNPVGRPDIQKFVGALHGVQADRGVFITTSRFSNEARSYVERIPNRIVLIDGCDIGVIIEMGESRSHSSVGFPFW